MDHAAAERLIRDGFAAALAAVDPAAAVRRVGSAMPKLLAGPPPVVLAVGKAAGGMTAGLVEALPHGIARGVVVTKDRRTVPALPPSVEVHEGSHPVPDLRSVSATEAALAMLAASADDEPVVVLISGGGSALFESPVEGTTLADIADLTSRMLRAGATIHELNAARGRLSRVKRGGLLRYIRHPSPVTLVLSDVIGNDLDVIASGPTVPESGDVGRILVVADNNTAVDAFVGVSPGAVVPDGWRQREGEARDLAAAWVETCVTAPSEARLLVGGGEATVTVRGDGVGGRNTEFAAAAALELDRRGMDDWVVASLATDGDDGPTGAAGGIASRRTATAARAMGIDPEAALAANDTARVLEAAGGLVVTGPTGTNVNDLYVAVRVR